MPPPAPLARGRRTWSSISRSSRACSAAPARVVRAVDGVAFSLARGRDARHRRRVRLRQVDDGAPADAPDRADRRHRSASRASWSARAELPLKAFRRQVQMVFQDSYASLNPRLTVEDSIAFAPMVHGARGGRGGAPRARAARPRRPRARALRRPLPARAVGRPAPARQHRPRARRCEPRVLILDEAVSALDKSVEAQVLNLLLDLKDEFGLTYIFISHDLEVVRFIAQPRAGDVSRPGRRGRPDRGALHRQPPPLHDGAARLDAVDGPRPPHRRRRRSPAIRPTRSIRRPAAASTPAARSPRRSARRDARARRHRTRGPRRACHMAIRHRATARPREAA